MSIKRRLEVLVNHYAANRGVGHSHVLRVWLNNAMPRENFDVEGHRGLKAAVLAYSQNNAKHHFGDDPKVVLLGFGCLETDRMLRARGLPLAVDNHAIWMLCEEALSEINRLEKELDKEKARH